MTSLEKELEQLKALLFNNTCNSDLSKLNTNNTSIVMYSSENLVSRNYKIDKEVTEQFVQFCKVQKLTNDYKVSDLASHKQGFFYKYTLCEYQASSRKYIFQ